MILRQLRRVTVLLFGIFVMGLGVAVSVRAGLGTSPVSSLPTVLSLVTPLTVGTYIFAFNVIFLLAQVLILRREFAPVQVVQLGVGAALGVFTDLHLAWTGWIHPEHYLTQWAWVLLSIVLVAVGVHIEVQPRLTYLPADGLVSIVVTRTGARFSTVKLLFDSAMVAAAVAVSLATMGGLHGVREGTIAAAFGVGAVMRVIGNVHSMIDVDRRER